jgi:predicted ATPase
MPFLRSVEIEQSNGLPKEYPFTVEALQGMKKLEFRTAITFFAGGNGTGKSTLLEGIASGVNSVPVRGDDAVTRMMMAEVEQLASHLNFQWNAKTRQGFFLRAEDFFDFKKSILASMADLETTAHGFASDMTGYGLELAQGSVRGQRAALARKYGENPDAMSHGESFLHFFQARFTGPGLYLLDEPDTALSPQSVLGLVAMLKDMTGSGAQFIIATHNPILLAFPDATLISFDRSPAAHVEYDDLEQVRLMRDFLNQPGAFLRRL